MGTILVQLADQQWTRQALHLACALARGQEHHIVLLRLMPVRHMSYLGTDWGNQPMSDAEYELLEDYLATAEDYGIAVNVTHMQSVSALESVIQAAELLEANTVFAQIPPSHIPYWHTLHRWLVEQRFMLARRTLYTLEEPRTSLEPGASITVKPARTAVFK
ncbi:MAG: hypothetical protein J0L63_12420 [Anaerolineae bacterium]|nr:hypothetical protein [Anaerolineae bacterium]